LLAWALGDGGAMARFKVGSTLICLGAIAGASAYLIQGCREYDTLTFIGLPTPMYPAETIFAISLIDAGLIGLVVLHAGAWWLAPLRLPPLPYLGRISYGLYLYHPVVYWAFDGFRRLSAPALMNQPWSERAMKLLLTVAVASASWYLVERPVLRWAGRPA
jgi:peptidoglycan/LPS O-acetylase OafA/YrhL